MPIDDFIGIKEVEEALDLAWLIDLGQGNFHAAARAAAQQRSAKTDSDSALAGAVVDHLSGQYNRALGRFEMAFGQTANADRRGLIAALACLSAQYRATRLPDNRCVTFPEYADQPQWQQWKLRWQEAEPQIQDLPTRLACHIIADLMMALGPARSFAMQLRAERGRLQEPPALLPSMQGLLALARQVGLPGIEVFVLGSTAELLGLAGWTDLSLSGLTEMAGACEQQQDLLSAAWLLLAAADVVLCGQHLGLPVLFGYAVDHYPLANDTNLLIANKARFDRSGIDTPRARALLDRAADHYAQIGVERGAGLVKLRLAYVDFIEGAERAAQGYAEAEQHFANTGDFLHQQAAFAGRLMCAWRQGASGSALAQAARLIGDYAKASGAGAWGNAWGLAFTDAMAEALAVRGDVDAALGLATVPQALFDALHLPLRRARVHMTRASAYASVEVHDEAALEINEALSLCRQGQDRMAEETDYARHAAVGIAEGSAQILIAHAAPDQLEQTVRLLEELLRGLPKPSDAAFEAAIATQAPGALAAVALAQGSQEKVDAHLEALARADAQAKTVEAGMLHLRAQMIRQLCQVNAGYLRGGAAMDQAREAEAARHFERAIHFAGELPDAHFQKAMIFTRWRRYADAVAALDTYVKQGLPRGSAIEETLSKALRVFRAAALDQGGLVSRQRTVARLYATAEAWEKAREMYRQVGLALGEEQTSDESYSLGSILDSVSLGGVALALGQPDAANRHFEAAARRIELRRQLFHREQFRRRFSGQRLIHRVYAEWADSHARQGHWLEALRVSELGRSRVLAESLEATRAMRGLPAYRVYLEQLALIERLTSLVSTLHQKGSDRDRAATLREQRKQALAVLAEQEAALARAAPRFRATLSSQFSLPKIGDRVGALAPGTLVLAYHFFGQSLLAWAISQEGIVASQRIERVGDRPFLARPFAARCQAWTRDLADAKEDEAFREQLSQALIGSFDGVIAASEQLVILPYAELSILPFNALIWRGRPLGLQRPISFLPSMSLLGKARTHSDRIERAFVLGDPSGMRFHFTDTGEEVLDPLPGSRIEAHAVSQLYRARPLLGSDATEAAVRTSLAQKPSVVHFATHGCLQPGAPLDSGISLAEGEALTADEFMGMDLPCDVVVLSACDTGGGKLSGSELVGLSRGLMIAGANAVVASFWPVADVATILLMQAFHRSLKAGQGAAKALFLAQRDLAATTAAEARRALEALRESVALNDTATLGSLKWCQGDIASYAGDERTAARLYAEAADAFQQAARPIDAARVAEEAARSSAFADQHHTFHADRKIFEKEADWAAFSVIGGVAS